MTKVRVLGTCYSCGRALFGYRATRIPTTEIERGKVVVHDPVGLRHGKCRGGLNPSRRATGVTPSDA